MIKNLCLLLAMLLLIVNPGMGEEGNSINDQTHGFNKTYLENIFVSKINPGPSNTVRIEASKFVSESGYASIPQVCDIYKNITKKWIYILHSDTGNYDHLNNAPTIINISYKGDCNEFAILMTAMVKEVAGATRIVFGVSPEKSHAWAEVYIGNVKKDKKSVNQICNWLKTKYNITDINLDPDTTTGEYWLNLDWGADFSRLAPCPGGSPKFPSAEPPIVVYSDKAVIGLKTAPLSKFTIHPCRMVNATYGMANASTNLTFDAQNISNVDSIVTYTWDFGDGTEVRSEAPKTNHTYIRPGKYTVLLIVIDEDNLQANCPVMLCVRGSGNGNQSGSTIESFSADPDNITSGTSSSLRWTTLGASNVTLSPGFGSVSPNGTQQVSPNATTTYTLNASNSKGFNVRSITILVKQRPKPLAQPKGIFTYSPMKPKVGDLITFDSSKSTGEGSNINYTEWNFGDGNYNSSRVCLHSYDKAGDYTVVLAVTDDNGQKNFTLKRIYVLPRELAVDSFNFTPNPVCSGQATVMSWATTGATNIVVTPGVGNLPASGSTSIFSEQSTGYTIQAYNDTSQTKPKTVFLEVKQCMLDVPSGSATPNIGITPGTLVIEGTVKYVGGNIVRIGVKVKLQEIFNGMTYDIDSTVSRRGDGTFKIVYSPEKLKNPYNPTLILQAFYGDKPFTEQVDIGKNRRVDLICTPP